MDEIHFAPSKKPQNVDSPVNTNKTMVSHGCLGAGLHPCTVSLAHARPALQPRWWRQVRQRGQRCLRPAAVGLADDELELRGARKGQGLQRRLPARTRKQPRIAADSVQRVLWVELQVFEKARRSQHRKTEAHAFSGSQGAGFAGSFWGKCHGALFGLCLQLRAFPHKDGPGWWSDEPVVMCIRWKSSFHALLPFQQSWRWRAWLARKVVFQCLFTTLIGK